MSKNHTLVDSRPLSTVKLSFSSYGVLTISTPKPGSDKPEVKQFQIVPHDQVSCSSSGDLIQFTFVPLSLIPDSLIPLDDFKDESKQ